MRRAMRAGGIAVAALATSLASAAPAVGGSLVIGTVDGLTYVQSQNSVTVEPSTSDSVAVLCPEGTRVLGGGFTIASGQQAGSRIASSYPIDDQDDGRRPDDGWAGTLHNARAKGDSNISAYAICKLSGPVTYVTGAGPLDASSGGVAAADCPAGMDVTGGGARLGGPIADAYLNRTVPFDDGDMNPAPDDGWKARGYNMGAGDRRIKTHAICIEADLDYVSTTSSNYLSFADCPDGTHGVGGGAAISGPVTNGPLVATNPFADPADPPDAGWVGVWDDSGALADITAHAVCRP